MNKFLWLIGLPIAVVAFGALAQPILGNIASSLNQQKSSSPAPTSDAQPSTVISIEAKNEKIGGDRLAHPPIRQTFTTSPYRLVIAAEDNWETPLTKAQLFRDEILLWENALPHQYGPKLVLISTEGNVLLLDEFINVASPHAITLIDSTGSTVAQHSFKDIQIALNLSAADLTKQATTGWWISAPPKLIESANCATIRTGNTTLGIDLSTGTIGQLDASSR